MFVYSAGGGHDTVQGGNTDGVNDEIKISGGGASSFDWRDIWITKSGSDLTIHVLGDTLSSVFLNDFDPSSGASDLDRITVSDHGDYLGSEPNSA